MSRKSIPWSIAVLLSILMSACSVDEPVPDDPAVTLANRLSGHANLFSEGYIDIGAARLHYVEAGQGPLMIFYHGFPSFWFSFYDQMIEFSTDHHVVAIDGLGANLSAKPEDLSLYRVENLASQLDLVARHFAGDDKFILVGHDWGGALSWAFAQQYPERLEKVVVLSAPPYNQFLELLADSAEQRSRSSYMFEFREGPGNEAVTENGGFRLWQGAYADLRASPSFTQERDNAFRQAIAMPGAVDSGLNWYRANIPRPDQIRQSDYWPSKSRRVAVPGLLISGENDHVFIPAFIESLPEYVEQLEVQQIPHAGHWPMIQFPEEVNRLMRRFIEG